MNTDASPPDYDTFATPAPNQGSQLNSKTPSEMTLGTACSTPAATPFYPYPPARPPVGYYPQGKV